MEIQPQHNQPIYSVSEVSSALRGVVENSFSHVRVRGEISGLKKATSGHVYFNLKDNTTLIKAVCWAGVSRSLKIALEEGLEIIATGKITTYAGRSEYQIVVSTAEAAGQGALLALLEKRKKQLEAEGLFALERKRPLPFLPAKIGVVTSPTGAVIRDILHRISERFPVHVLVWPVLVQGEGAKEQIAAAIQGFNAMHPPPDLLIVARGGGSIEDLWAFNQEIVVRAAAASKIPLISAIGHETDNSLLDLVADYRAPTPTAAAEKAVPERIQLAAGISELGSRLPSGLLRIMQRQEERLQALSRMLPKADSLISNAAQMLDERSERLAGALPRLLQMQQMRLEKSASSLRHPREIINLASQRLEGLQGRLELRGRTMFELHERRLESLSRLLQSVDHKQIMARGFALVRDGEGRLLTRATQVGAGEIRVIFDDAEVKAHVS